jgi:hypothetical protein
MNRRGFLRMLGTGAAVGAVAAVAPSEVWPFRKIFLPVQRFFGWDWGFPGDVLTIAGCAENELNGRFDMVDMTYWNSAGMRTATGAELGLSRAPYPGPLRLDFFNKQIADNFYKERSLYRYFKENKHDEAFQWVMTPDQAKAFEKLAKEGETLFRRRRPAFRVPQRVKVHAKEFEGSMRTFHGDIQKQLEMPENAQFVIRKVDDKRRTIDVEPVVTMCNHREPDVTTVENEFDEITEMANELLKGV